MTRATATETVPSEGPGSLSTGPAADPHRRHDHWLALVLLAFCGVAARLTMDVPADATGTTLGPNFFPWAMVIAIAVLSIGLLARSLKSRHATASAPAGSGRTMLLKLGFFVILMLVYAAVYIPVGYLGSTIGFFVVAMLVLGERRPIHVVAIPVAIVVGIYLVFTQLLKVYLP